VSRFTKLTKLTKPQIAQPKTDIIADIIADTIAVENTSS
jgi:hypothetical protein